MVKYTQEEKNEICKNHKYCADCPLGDCGARQAEGVMDKPEQVVGQTDTEFISEQLDYLIHLFEKRFGGKR